MEVSERKKPTTAYRRKVSSWFSKVATFDMPVGAYLKWMYWFNNSCIQKLSRYLLVNSRILLDIRFFWNNLCTFAVRFWHFMPAWGMLCCNKTKIKKIYLSNITQIEYFVLGPMITLCCLSSLDGGLESKLLKFIWWEYAVNVDPESL